MTRFVNFHRSGLARDSGAILGQDPRIVFCAALDRNGILADGITAIFSQLQGGDLAWNAANCRNRRMFNDRVGLACGRNEKPFLVQTYRREHGRRGFALMKDASAPIVVKGRHWGGFRMGYKPARGLPWSPRAIPPAIIDRAGGGQYGRALPWGS